MAGEMRTTEMKLLLDRFQEGEQAAIDELLQRTKDRLQRLAAAMLRRFPKVRQREQTDDVLQEAMLSLIGALSQLSFSSTREFYGLAAEHIRRRLIDLSRRYSQPRCDPLSLREAVGASDLLPDGHSENSELERWQDFHEAVAALPADLREVFSLRFYHGRTHQEIADLLQVSLKTATRIWLRAQVELAKRLGEPLLPGADD
jgi:RNA polymerase sigma factor (sigma-70 family)